METVINIYIVRHGQSLMNEQKLIQGQKEFSNNGLSKEGIKQIVLTENQDCKKFTKVVKKKEYL